MNLEESNEFVEIESSKRKKKKFVLFLIFLCVIAIFALIFLILFLTYKDSHTKKLFLNQTRKNWSNSLFITQDGNTYVSAEEFANFLGYKYHHGEYNKYNQDENYCYVETAYDIISIKADSSVVKKYIINENTNDNNVDDNKNSNKVNNNNTANPNEGINQNVFIVKSKNNTMQVFELAKNTIKYNNTIYVPIENVNKIFNVKLEVNANRTYVSDLNFLYQNAVNYLNKNNNRYTEISNYYENIVGLVNDYLIIKDNTNKYGVVSLVTGKNIVDFDYIDIQYIQNKEEFFVYAKNNTIGLISKDTGTIIPPTYSEMSVFDEINGLYLVKAKNGYGIVNRKGEEIIPTSFEDIGFKYLLSYNDIELPDSETPNLIESKYIIVSDNNKVGLYDLNGKVVLKPVYDSFGYSVTEKDKKAGYQSVFLLPEESGVNGIVIEQNGFFGIYDFNRRNLEIPCSLSKVYSTEIDNEKEYYMIFQDEVFNIKEYFEAIYPDESKTNDNNKKEDYNENNENNQNNQNVNNVNDDNNTYNETDKNNTENTTDRNEVDNTTNRNDTDNYNDYDNDGNFNNNNNDNNDNNDYYELDDGRENRRNGDNDYSEYEDNNNNRNLDNEEW